MGSTQDHWRRYEPTDDAPWGVRRVVHLHRRAGFAATWSEIQRDAASDPHDAITRLTSAQTRVDGQPANYESTAQVLLDAALASQLDRRVKAAWIYRMLLGPDPLGERLVLAWHNHFATSNRKVNDLTMMQGQNDVLRRDARANFGELLGGVVRQPAMLVWLDADKNRAGHPNENLGRELMELFTIGLGQFTEADVQEAARALTGWRVAADTFRFDAREHDDGQKTVLGTPGKMTGDDLLALLVAQPATARRIAWRLCRLLMGDAAVEPPVLEALAAGLREHDLNIGWGVETILRSERFFAAENLIARVIGPPEFVVGAARALECFQPLPSTLLLADWTARMGQDLYYPPNVGGWSEGQGWLTTGAIVARANFAAALVAGRLAQNAPPPDLAALVERHANTKDLGQSVDWLGQLLFGGLSADVVQSVSSVARQHAATADSQIPAAVLALLSRPEAHLG